MKDDWAQFSTDLKKDNQKKLNQFQEIEKR